MNVSIIIINYNTFRLTCECIQSIFEKTRDITFEVILVDNASTEADPEKFKEKFPAIRLVKSGVNLGFAGGNNLGIKYATGDNILLLNSDTLLLEDSVRFIYESCKQVENLGTATIKLLFPDGRLQPAARKFPSILAHFLKTTRLRIFSKTLYSRLVGNYDYNKTFTCDWIWGTFFYFPAKNLQYMNGQLSETYFMYSEDVEWCYVFKKKGLLNYYFSESAIIHYGGQSSTSGFKNKLLLQNHLHFIRHNYGFLPWCTERFLFWLDEIEEKLRARNK